MFIHDDIHEFSFMIEEQNYIEKNIALVDA